ncbi:MAG: multidrug efflux RND transporter permease subunit [Azospira sp.]|jgi:hydrophobe/amphiphile efflux-1 (HAE1) family protein|nr:multidrug efflux RND transporter permease subunit [Azospira sp.]
MISRFFIDRPIFAVVVSLFITLAGLLAMKNLPVAQYPEIAPPSVSVSAVYPGASAETVASAVAAPLEQQINGAEGMRTMNSTSSATGVMSLSASFAIGTDIDRAASDIQNRVNLAMAQMPAAVRQGGVMVQKSSSNMLMVIAVQSPDGSHDEVYVSNYASLNLLDELKRIPGAGKVEIMGARDYAMRLWLKPDRMAQMGISAEDIAAAVREQNAQVAVGQIGAPPNSSPVELTFPVTTRGRLTEVGEFENIVVRTGENQARVRVKDVARVELGAVSYDFRGALNGKPATLITIYQSPTANALDLARAVRDRMSELSQRFPSGIAYTVPFDSTRFVDASIKEVVHTFFEALLLVLLVVFLFLQNWRATLIPLLAVPVSVLGAFAGMYLLGYSINTLTLFGMVLAIGIVVDDAIVVVENVERLMHEAGLSAREAARQAMDEVTGPVIAIVLVLCSVFIPVAFMGGTTGQLYRQFAVTIAIAVVLSGVVALTLTPALAGLLLKPESGDKPRFFRWFNRRFEALTEGYARGTRRLMKRTAGGLLIYGIVGLATLGLFKAMPTTFVPGEDQGYLIAAAFLPDGASLGRTAEVSREVEAGVRAHPAVRDVISFTGFSMLEGRVVSSAATYFVMLRDWDERKEASQHAYAVLGDLYGVFAGVREAMVLAFNPPSIPGLGSTGGLEFIIQNRGEGGAGPLAGATQDFIARASARPELAGLSTQLRGASPQLYLDVDREKAHSLGVPLSALFGSLQPLFGAAYVDDFSKFGKVFRVTMQAEPEYRSRPEDIENVFVRSNKGHMVPLKSLVRVEHSSGPAAITRVNGFPSASINAMPAPGRSSGEAMRALEEVAAGLPPGMAYQWGGQSLEEKESGGSTALIFGAGLLMIFLILAAQYEKWSLPFGVMLAVPFGLFGAYLAIALRGIASDVYFQIGLLTLVALSAKNAILIVEFAVLERARGLSSFDAALSAARLRFRPILMTSLAFVLGVVPLALASGAGAGSRHSIGTGVLGGMVVATLLALFFVPLFYDLIERLGARRRPVPPASEGG